MRDTRVKENGKIDFEYYKNEINSLNKEICELERENNKFKIVTDLLKENIQELESDINRLYYTMISLKAIANEEIEKLEDIEEI